MMYYSRDRPVQQYCRAPVTCDKCGQLIGFIQNVKGKWYPVNVFPTSRGFGYYGNYGNHGNAKDVHMCDRHSQYYPYHSDRLEVVPNRSELSRIIMIFYEANTDDQRAIVEAMPHNVMRRVLEQFLVD